MLAPLPPLEAFRRDAGRKIGGMPSDAKAAAWLESTMRLQRAAMVRGEERERLIIGFLAQHNVVAFPSARMSPHTLLAAVMPLAAAMEDAAFFRLSHSMLSLLLVLIPTEEILARGRILLKVARIARQVGEHDAALAYFRSTEELGHRHNFPELTAGAWTGLGILAELRGDFPEARRLLGAVLELEGALPESVSVAHHGLMVAAATALDYDTAAVHAWKAYEGASTPIQQTEMLVSLAQLLLVAGHSKPALRGFAAALARDPLPRLALPALGGAACAASQALRGVPRRTLVRRLVYRVHALVKSLGDGSSLPYQSAVAFVEASEALTAIGEAASAERTRELATALAASHGFHELTFRLENPPARSEPTVLAPKAAAVVEAVESLEGAELIGATG
jgi:tetratricopeptide (TPR) repeat protein